jgi:UDP-N-acetylglucosamine 1-carboxyvinyltransferase
MMAAVLAEGVTVIDGAAEEPEVVDLANFLIAMGAKIEGAGTRSITIEGVSELHGAEHEVIPDRIEAGTFLAAGAISGDEVTVSRVNPTHLRSITDLLSESGFEIRSNGSQVTIRPGAGRRPLKIDALPYPAFPTDMQAQMCAMLATTDGISVVTDHVFPHRFMHVAEMKRMGADIDLQGGTAVIKGISQMSGAPVMASDLRASAALVLAGLQADGITEVNRVYHIDRGYESIDEKLNELGAHLERVKV